MRLIQFVPDDILRVVMYLFWEKGYAGTSMDEIVETTQVNKQSLYNFFGDKKSFFLKVLYFYFEDTMAVVQEILSHRKAAPDLLYQMFQFLMDRSNIGPYPEGCLIINTISEFGQYDQDIKAAFDAMEEEFDKTLQKTILIGQKEKTITDAMKALEIAAFLKCTLSGVLILNRQGKSVQYMRQIAHHAIQSISR